MFELHDALHRVVEVGGSDLHLKVPAHPLIRVNGVLEPIPGADELTPEDTERVFRDMLTDEGKLKEFATEHEVDYAYGVPGLCRFRVNAFRQRGAISIVCRVIPHQIRTIEELGLPDVISELAKEERGIILADTKFELGLDGEGTLVLGDEALTPDSSRFWPADTYRPGGPQPSYDKQFVRDYCESLGWDKTAPGLSLIHI